MLPRGTINQIVTHLHSQKIDINRLDSFILRFFGNPQSGWIDLRQIYLSKGNFFYRLTKSKAALKEIKLIPGETMFFFLKDIAQVFGINEDELREACEQNRKCLEGNFVPQTYKIPYGATSGEILEYLLDYSETIHKDFAHKNGIVYGSQQWMRLLSKGSIIQKEAADIDEMPIISAVIENRIKKGMPLQMDGSLNYGKYSHDKITPKRIREDMSIFNTYKNKGIPPSPSGSVSMHALEASLKPASVTYLYFVRTKSGKHAFSETYREHKNNFQK